MGDIRPLVLSELNPPLNPTVIRDVNGLNEVARFFDRADVFGFDCETNIVDFFYHRKTRTVQIGNREEQFIIDLWELAGRDTEKLHTVQGHCGREAKADPTFNALRDVLRQGLESGKHLKVGHNLLFDYVTLKWCLGLRPWNFYDSQLAEKSIYCGLVNFWTKGWWGLDDLVVRHLNLEISKEQQKTFTLDSELTQEQIDYAALDVRLPLALRLCQKRILAKEKLEWTAKIEFDAIPAFGDMHLNGLLTDRDKWMGLVKETRNQHSENIQDLDKHFLGIVGSKRNPPFSELHEQELEQRWRGTKDKTQRAEARKLFQRVRKARREFEKAAVDFEGEAAINYGSPDQLLDALRKAGYGDKKLPDTNDQTLKKLADDPIIKAIRNYRETHKTLTTYGESFLDKNVQPETGRIHSEFEQWGAETGRTSSRNPNVQNIKRGSEWRNCFVAPPGYKILTIDYNGCELRILAELSKEPVWLDAFNNGWDVHSVGAEILFRDEWKNAAEHGCAYYEKHQKCKCKGHKILRDRIKAINFGLAYGMEARRLAEELGIPLKEAEALLLHYKGQFVVVTAYLEKSGNSAVGNLEARTMSGRRRLFTQPTRERAIAVATEKLKKWGKPGEKLQEKHIMRALKGLWSGISREGKNTPIQGTNADIAKLAMGCGFDADGNPYLWHILEPEFDAKQVNFVHDEFVIEAKDEVSEACYSAVANCMERAGAAFVKSIPMTTEGHIAECWQKG